MDTVFERPIQFVKGVGEKRAALFHRLGIHTVGDLLSFYPRQYEDWSKIVPIAQAPIGEPCCVSGVVLAKPIEHRIRKGLTLYKFTVSDGISGMHVTLFNNKYAAASLKVGEEYVFFGTVEQKFHRFEMSAPAFALREGGNRIRPIYHQTAGLNSAAIERTVKAAMALVGEPLATEALPEDLRRRHHLIGRSDAIKYVHFPPNNEALTAARRRLVFEELLVLQLGLLRLKGHIRAKTAVRIQRDHFADFAASLPFTLTGAQQRAIADGIRDMQSEHPMNRLVQGDVGSGKTAVAAGIAHTLIGEGWQAAMMAPTEILARQHAASLRALLPDNVNVGLLVGSMTAAQKREALAAIEDGSLDLVVGTHALLSDKVHFANLGLVITDEQHRFGVGQRAALCAKGQDPHRLVMSATPIPRTLALMIYGDLDVSVLDELPPGRQPIETYAVGSDKRERVHTYIDRFLSEGRQGYIVCPLIEEDEEDTASDLISAEEYYQRLQATPLAKYRIGLLHGRMKGAEKDAVMAAFAAHELDLLVATTVIEVGVDVPNAVIMVIENAERFGLAQMHQLRGRVGRGKHASTCILISDSHAPDTRHRLQAMCATTDGFRIAEEDLKLRGPGDFFGNRQHGLPVLSIADLQGDLSVLQQAQQEALDIAKADPLLQHEQNRPIKELVTRLFAQVGEDGLN